MKKKFPCSAIELGRRCRSNAVAQYFTPTGSKHEWGYYPVCHRHHRLACVQSNKFEGFAVGTGHSEPITGRGIGITPMRHYS